jgi:hypothetical protein
MEMIFEFSLRAEDKIVEARGILKNILNYALGDRLKNLKNALPAFKKSRVKGKGPTVRAGMSTLAPLEAGLEFSFQLLMTPKSSAGNPIKKKRRLVESRVAAAVEANNADLDNLESLFR